jgi:hypothetical protein
VELVKVPFYFINLLPTSLLYISILLAKELQQQMHMWAQQQQQMHMWAQQQAVQMWDRKDLHSERQQQAQCTTAAAVLCH